jgi:hypothetical protein
MGVPARVVREVGDLLRRSRAADQQLPSLSIDAEIRFRSPAERAAFTAELTRAVTGLVSHYHDADAPGGRAHRLVVVAHPLPRDARASDPAPATGESAPTESHPEEPSCP